MSPDFQLKIGNSPDDSVHTGAFDFYIECGETGSYIAVLVAKPADQSHAVILEGQAITDGDVEALDQVLKTFKVVDILPGS